MLSVVRYPRGTESKIVSAVFKSASDFTIDTAKKCDVLIATYGRITEEVIKAKLLLEKNGYSVVILKFLKLKPLDFTKINQLIDSLEPKIIYGVEEGMKIGGFCEYLFANVTNNCEKQILAIDEKIVPHGTIDELYDFVGLSAKKISSQILKWM